VLGAASAARPTAAPGAYVVVAEAPTSAMEWLAADGARQARRHRWRGRLITVRVRRPVLRPVLAGTGAGRAIATAGRGCPPAVACVCRCMWARPKARRRVGQ
jgi:hypothetical protein